MQNLMVVWGTGVATTAAEMAATTAAHTLVAPVTGSAGFRHALDARKRAPGGRFMIFNRC